jgi:hypothetical protein
LHGATHSELALLSAQSPKWLNLLNEIVPNVTTIIIILAHSAENLFLLEYMQAI